MASKIEAIVARWLSDRGFELDVDYGNYYLDTLDTDGGWIDVFIADYVDVLFYTGDVLCLKRSVVVHFGDPDLFGKLEEEIGGC